MPTPGLPASDPVRADAPQPPKRQLPPHQGKLGRVTEHASGLVTDSMAYGRYRVQLASTVLRRSVEERVVRTKTTIEATKDAYVKSLVPSAVLALGGLILLLIAFGFLLSAAFNELFIDHQIWALAAGFSTAMAILLAAAGIWFAITNPAKKSEEIQRRTDAAVASVRKKY
ncbi:hypothetical protein BH23BAC4_BH23BAC4_06830 [soil metagenome]